MLQVPLLRDKTSAHGVVALVTYLCLPPRAGNGGAWFQHVMLLQTCVCYVFTNVAPRLARDGRVWFGAIAPKTPLRYVAMVDYSAPRGFITGV